MRQIALRALRAHWPTAVGVFLTMTLAAALVVASGVLLESGLRASDPFSPTATALPAVMGSFGGVAVMLAVFVVASAFAAALRDRRREFALLRAVGASSRQVRRLVGTEVMVISGAAVLLGSLLGLLGASSLVPLLRSSGIVAEGFSPHVSPWPVLAAAVLLLPAAWLAGRLAAREMARLSPTAAVSTTTADARGLGTGRIVAAWICFAAGVASTTTPVFMPGAMGGAAGAASALLFITAVALAGPALVQRGASWLAGRRALERRAAPVLATANARGYSRRLTAAVVPLALLVSLGSVQTGVNRTVAVAASQQVEDAFAGGLVWSGSAAEADDARVALGSLPGVAAVALTEASMVQVMVDGEDSDAALFGGAEWETDSLRLLDDSAGVIDPAVRAGSLDDLAGPDTVAVASDSLTLTGRGMGDSIWLRYMDGSEQQARIVAVYERGLGLGGLIVGPDGFAPAVSDGSDGGGATLVAQTKPSNADAVAAEAAELGFTLVPAASYAESAVSASSGDSRLSNTLLMVLLAFVGIAAANALLIATRARSGEFALLGRVGATRRQLRAMLGIEAALVGIGAVALGALTALPGLVAASVALVRGFSWGVDPVMFGALAGAAVAIAFLGVAGAKLRVRTV